MEALSGFYVMTYRQLKKFSRARSRVIGTIVNPIIWVLFFGLGWSGVFNFPMAKQLFGGVDYLTFLAPGVLGMTLFLSGFISGISIIWDKQFGFFKEVLVAPTSRVASIIGRIFGDSLTTLIQLLIIFALLYPLAGSLSLMGLIPSLLIAFLSSMMFSGLGVIIALKMRSLEGFQLLINLVMMPTLFLSGALYPITTMPYWMKLLAYADPLTYPVDGMRYFLAGTSALQPTIDVVLVTAFTALSLGISSVLFRNTTVE